MDKKALVEGYGRLIQSSKRKYFVLVDYASGSEQMVWRIEVYKSECEWLRRVSPDDRVALHDLFFVDISHRKHPPNALLLLKETGSYAFVIDDQEERTRWQALCQRLIQRNRKEHRYPGIVQALEARVKVKCENNSKKQRAEMKKCMFESCRIVFIDDSILLVTTSLHHPDLIISYSEIRSYSSRDDGRLELLMGRGFSMGECRVRFGLADKMEASYVHRQLEQQLNDHLTRPRSSWRSSRISTLTDSTDHSFNNSRLSYCSSSSSSTSAPKIVSPSSLQHMISHPTKTNSRTSSLIGIFSLFHASKSQCNVNPNSTPENASSLHQPVDEDGVSTLEGNPAVRPDRSATNDTIIGVPTDNMGSEKQLKEKFRTSPSAPQCNSMSQDHFLLTSLRYSKDNHRKNQSHSKSMRESTALHSISMRLPKTHSALQSSQTPFFGKVNRNDRYDGEYVVMGPRNATDNKYPHNVDVMEDTEFESIVCNPAEHYLIMGEDFFSNLRLSNVSPNDSQQNSKEAQNDRRSVDSAMQNNLGTSSLFSSSEAVPFETIEKGPYFVDDGNEKSEQNSQYCIMVNQLKATDFYKRAYSWGARTQPHSSTPKSANQQFSLNRQPTARSSAKYRDVNTVVKTSYQSGFDFVGRVSKGKQPTESTHLHHDWGSVFDAKRNCGHRNDSEIFMELDFGRPRTSSDSRTHRPVSMFQHTDSVFARVLRSVVSGKVTSPPRSSANNGHMSTQSSHSSSHGVRSVIRPPPPLSATVATRSKLLTRQQMKSSDNVIPSSPSSPQRSDHRDEQYLSMTYSNINNSCVPDASPSVNKEERCPSHSQYLGDRCLFHPPSNQSNASECSTDSLSSTNLYGQHSLSGTGTSLPPAHLLTTTPNG